jgi:DNA-binding CsgD family transcriptional regulator
MSDLLQLLSPKLLENIEEQPSVTQIARISNIFAPGENIYFTNEYSNKVNNSPTVISDISGTPSLIEEFQIDETAKQKLSIISNLAEEYFRNNEFQQHEILKTKILSSLHIKTKNGSTKKMLYHELAIDTAENNRITKSVSVFTNITYLQIPEGAIYLMDILTSEVIDQIQYELDDTYYLSETEYLIVSNTILGYGNNEIAELLNLSENTIRKYRKNVIKKTSSKNLFEVIKKFHQNKIKPKNK